MGNRTLNLPMLNPVDTSLGYTISTAATAAAAASKTTSKQLLLQLTATTATMMVVVSLKTVEG